MPKASKFSPDEGITIYDLKDSEAVHYGEQSKGYVGKNLLQNNAVSKVTGNVKYTVNADKSITGNGTATSNANLKICSITLTQGVKYILSGGSRLQFYYAPDYTQLNINGTGQVEFTAPQTGEYIAYFRCANGETLDNVTIYPMLRFASISDSTYEPFLTPNTDLMSWADNTILGAKNFVKYPFNKVVLNGTTSIFTNNNDGTFNINGTPSTYSYINVNFRSNTEGLFLKNGTYIYSGCPADGNKNSKYYANITCTKNGSVYVLGEDEGNGVTITINGDDYSDDGAYVGINFYVIDNYAADTLIWKPMIRLASDTDNTYVPYAATNRGLTEMLIPQESAFNDIISGASVEGNTNYLIKIGNVVYAWLYLTSVTVAAWTKIAGIPEGYRPKHDMFCRDAIGNRHYKISVAGNLSCAEELSNAALLICFSWITT